MKDKNSIIIIQGAQWGSEAKGTVAHAIALKENVKHAVRTGSINAGHNVIMPDGSKFAFQQLPTPSIIPGVTSYIGPGAYVNYGIIANELQHVGANTVFLDDMCGIHLEEYTSEAKKAGRNLLIGATGKGCAEAIINKIKDRGLPNHTDLLFKNYYERLASERTNVFFTDTAEILTDAYFNGRKILIEGTQGTLLDFHTGPYPFVTSRQTIASAWVAESGLSPALNYEVVLVARTCPIRVAGKSGPMNNEITWPKLARRINKRLSTFGLPTVVKEDSIVEFEQCLNKARNKDRSESADPLSEASLVANTEAIMDMSEESRKDLLGFFETTTVTKRLRRIADLDYEQLAKTVKKEQPTYMVLTFLNYIFPELVYTRNITSREVLLYLEDLQDRIGCWIKYVTIGPKHTDMLETPTYLYGRSLKNTRSSMNS